MEDFAGDRIAFDAGGGEDGRRSEGKDGKEAKDKADPS